MNKSFIVVEEVSFIVILFISLSFRGHGVARGISLNLIESIRVFDADDERRTRRLKRWESGGIYVSFWIHIFLVVWVNILLGGVRIFA